MFGSRCVRAVDYFWQLLDGTSGHSQFGCFFQKKNFAVVANTCMAGTNYSARLLRKKVQKRARKIFAHVLRRGFLSNFSIFLVHACVYVTGGKGGGVSRVGG